MAGRGFQQVSEIDVPDTAQVIEHPARQDQDAALQLMMLALKALSQRAVVALSSLFTAAGLFSAWWLWDSVLPEPSDRQLVGVALYAVFLIVLELVRRR